jgi:hypothetical protein
MNIITRKLGLWRVRLRLKFWKPLRYVYYLMHPRYYLRVAGKFSGMVYDSIREAELTATLYFPDEKSRGMIDYLKKIPRYGED